MSEATEDEIVQRIIRQCVEPTVTECRLWRCQKANKCQKHDYRKSLGETLDALAAKPNGSPN